MAAPGAGKDVYSRAIHRESKRPGPFIAVNCASIPRELVESELFGYVRGAHSQADNARIGLIQDAEGGTLLLDEIGEMRVDVQAKLLRFLQSREITPLGSNRAIKADIHVIAATNRKPTQDRIRPDLLHRLGEPMELPPLRRRREDIPMLVRRFLGPGSNLTARALQAMLLYAWPGNVRELENCCRRAALLAAGGIVDIPHLPSSIVGNLSLNEEEPDLLGNAEQPATAPTIAASRTARASPRARPSSDELRTLLRQHQGNVAGVARQLGRKWQVVWKWLKSDGINPQDFREASNRN